MTMAAKTGRHIAVVDPAMHTPEVDCFNHLVSLTPLPLTYHLPKIGGTDTLENDPEGLAGVILLGSASSVHDPSEWQERLRAWLRERFSQSTPVLGICYGHQLIAHMFGAEVEFLSRDGSVKKQGFRQVSFSPSPMHPGGSGRGELFVSHREVVKNAPDEMELVASSPEVAVEALVHRKLPVWTLQPHPEATNQFVRHQKLPPEPDLSRFKFGYDLVRRFLQLCESRGN